MINWRDCIVPIRKPPEKPKRQSKPYTAYEAATALTLEARRRGQDYGELTASTDWREQEEIIAAYMAQKQNHVEKLRQQCDGCIYHKPLNRDPAVKHCTFHQNERIRRKDEDGMCLEYTAGKENAP